MVFVSHAQLMKLVTKMVPHVSNARPDSLVLETGASVARLVLQEYPVRSAAQVRSEAGTMDPDVYPVQGTALQWKEVPLVSYAKKGPQLLRMGLVAHVLLERTTKNLRCLVLNAI
ncbi:protein kinase [Gracilaria domingensis]|nr:protein kinase [Gracilaria domingensis]